MMTFMSRAVAGTLVLGFAAFLFTPYGLIASPFLLLLLVIGRRIVNWFHGKYAQDDRSLDRMFAFNPQLGPK